jgi:hypothetical protein
MFVESKVTCNRLHRLNHYGALSCVFQMAAQRFVNYWTCRRQVFGTEKFTQPMTLSGALRDDLKALQRGVCRILPKPDASGRPILVFNPTLNTREGYDSDSLVCYRE